MYLTGHATAFSISLHTFGLGNIIFERFNLYVALRLRSLKYRADIKNSRKRCGGRLVLALRNASIRTRPTRFHSSASLRHFSFPVGETVAITRTMIDIGGPREAHCTGREGNGM